MCVVCVGVCVTLYIHITLNNRDGFVWLCVNNKQFINLRGRGERTWRDHPPSHCDKLDIIVQTFSLYSMPTMSPVVRHANERSLLSKLSSQQSRKDIPATRSKHLAVLELTERS